MPLGDWEIKVLSDLAESCNGAGIKQQHFSVVGTRLARVSDFTDRSIDLSDCSHVEPIHARQWTGHLLKEGDVIVATVGSWPPNWSSVVGKAVRVPPEAVGAIQNQNSCRLRAKEGMADQRFLFYLVRSSEFVHHAAYSAGGSANQARLAVKNLMRFRFECPPVSEQRTIAKVLGSLDDKIDLNRRMNQTLQQMAAAIFKAWFVDFEPVRAKADGAKSFPSMPQKVFDALPTEFTDSPLGAIPKGWTVGSIGDIGENVRNGVKPDEIDPTTPYIGLEHMPRRSISLGDWDFAGDVGSNKSSFEMGEILFGKLRPYFHKVGVAVLDGICSTDILVVRPKSPSMAGLLIGYLSSKEFVNYANGVSTGTRMPRTNWKDMALYDTAVPPSNIIKLHNDLIAPMIGLIRSNIMQSRTLAEARDALLPKLLSGQIRVGEANRIAEEVA
jgi:type I restriction enzyme, S subunit